MVPFYLHLNRIGLALEVNAYQQSWVFRLNYNYVSKNETYVNAGIPGLIALIFIAYSPGPGFGLLSVMSGTLTPIWNLGFPNEGKSQLPGPGSLSFPLASIGYLYPVPKPNDAEAVLVN